MISDKGWLVVGGAVILGIIALLLYVLVYRPCVMVKGLGHHRHVVSKTILAGITITIIGFLTGIVLKVLLFVLKCLSILP